MSQLHTFHLWLCRHVRFNVESVVDDPRFAERLKALPPTLVESLDVKAEYFKYDELVTPNEHGNFPDAVRLAVDHGKKQPLLLNDEELGQLESLTDVPIRHTKLWDSSEWAGAHPDHYERAINCIQEIANKLNSFEANNWSSESERFALQLGRDGLHRADGVQIVRQWTGRIRMFLRAMGRCDLLPRPEGQYPTPTTFALLPSLVDTYLRELDKLSGTPYAQRMREALRKCSLEDKQRLAAHRGIADVVTVMRAALAESGLKDKAMKSVRGWITRQNDAAVKYKGSKQEIELALRILHELGEYPGIGQSKSGNTHGSSGS